MKVGTEAYTFESVCMVPCTGAELLSKELDVVTGNAMSSYERDLQRHT